MMKRITVLVVCLAALWGCESTRIALEGEARVNDVQQTLWENVGQRYRFALFNAALARLQLSAIEDPNDLPVALNLAWQRRDELEFWQVQWERAKAYRLVTVDAKLVSDQSILELLWKRAMLAVDRANEPKPASDLSIQPAAP